MRANADQTGNDVYLFSITKKCSSSPNNHTRSLLWKATQAHAEKMNHTQYTVKKKCNDNWAVQSENSLF